MEKYYNCYTNYSKGGHKNDRRNNLYNGKKQ